MDNFLRKTLDFSKSVFGLVAIIAAVIVFINPVGLANTNTFDLRVISSLLGRFILAFIIIYSQLKNKTLVSHLLILWVFGSAIAVFLGSLNAITLNANFLMNVLRVIFLAYALLVVMANIMYEKPTPKNVDFKSLFSLGLLLIVIFLLNGLVSALVEAVILLVLLYFGSKFLAYLYGLYIAVPPLLNALYYIFDDFKVFSNYLVLAGYGVATFFIVKDLILIPKEDDVTNKL